MLKAFMRLDKCGFPQRPSFVSGKFLLPYFHLEDGGLGLEDGFGDSGRKGCIRDRELILLSLFLSVLKHVDVLGDACSVTIM